MKNTKPQELCKKDLELAQSSFTAWRSRKQSAKERIPDELWNLAVGLTQKYSTCHVSKTLRLSPTDLKKQVKSRMGADLLSSVQTANSFIQLNVSDGPYQGASGPQCLLELNRSDGTQLKIYSAVGGSIDITRICESFLKGC